MEYRDFLAAEDKQFRAHLEEHQRVIGGVLEEVKAQGDRIAEETAQTVETSGREAVAQAQASLDQVAQAAQKVGELAHQASETTGKAAQRSEELLGRLDQASQRMVASGQKVEAGLDGLLPKVAGVREGLERELVDIVSVAATTEEKVKKMVASLQASLAKEIENEIRAKLHKAANDAANRIYGIADWWSWFSKVGVHVILIVVALSAGISGWWFGKHQLGDDTYQQAMERMRTNARVGVYAYKFFPGPSGELKWEVEPISAPLVWLGKGQFATMVRNDQGQWAHGNIVVPRENLVLAEAYDSTRKEDNLIKSNCP